MKLYEKIPNKLPTKYKKTIFNYMTELQEKLGNNLKLIL